MNEQALLDFLKDKLGSDVRHSDGLKRDDVIHELRELALLGQRFDEFRFRMHARARHGATDFGSPHAHMDDGRQAPGQPAAHGCPAGAWVGASATTLA